LFVNCSYYRRNQHSVLTTLLFFCFSRFKVMAESAVVRRAGRNVQELLDSLSDDSDAGRARRRRRRSPGDASRKQETAQDRARRTALMDTDDEASSDDSLRVYVQDNSVTKGEPAPVGAGLAVKGDRPFTRPSAVQDRMDKELVLWLNSQAFPSALLCSDVTDLRSGMPYICSSIRHNFRNMHTYSRRPNFRYL
jgi:hypothetical protein